MPDSGYILRSEKWAERTAVVGSARPLSRIPCEFCPKEFGLFREAYETVGHKCTKINFVYDGQGRELSRRI